MARAAVSLLLESATPYCFDPYGNLVVGAASVDEYLKRLERHSGPPLPLFIAHMDHPGFHGVAWTKANELNAEWLGGGPTKYLPGATVWLARGGESVGQGTIVKARTEGRRIRSLTVRPEQPLDGAADELYGGLAFRAPVWKAGDRVYTKAADDLVGAYSILELAAQAGAKPLPFLGVLTRAEEVGFIGMIHHFEGVLKGGFRDKLFVVSLETSRAFPGAEWGKGPVVRLGDRATVFDPAAVEWMTIVAGKVLGKRFQRRVMDGGVCEGTVANALGYRTAGISVPLGNYHNECFTKNFEKEKSGGPAPEFVSWRDVEGLLKLCRGLVDHPFPGESAWGRQRESFQKYLAEFREKMARSFAV